MFRGSIPAAMQAIVHQLVAAWPVDDIYVGCSGNFTVERVLAHYPHLNIHSNDVTIHSSALGAYLSGAPFRIELRPEFDERLGWMREYLKTPADIAATIMLAGRLAEGLRADGTFKDNAYYNRIIPAYEAQWDTLHQKTTAKLENVSLSLASYSPCDVVPWMHTIPQDAGFISYPPFFSGDYESMFKKLDMLFDWDKPSYEEIGDGDLESFLQVITDRKYWAFGSNRRWPDYDQFLRGMTQTTNRGVPIYVYTSKGSTRIVVPQQQIQSLMVPHIGPEDEIGTTMSLVELTTGQFQALRSQYMNPYIIPGAASMAIAVLVDNVLIGCYAFSTAPNMASINIPSTIYLLSDFPVSHSKYRRLSKLVLYAALSRESQLLAESAANRRCRRLFTTAFSQKPASMKYRGLFNVHSRTENHAALEDSDDYYQQRFKINYVADMGAWTLQEGLATWLKKHASK